MKAGGLAGYTKTKIEMMTKIYFIRKDLEPTALIANGLMSKAESKEVKSLERDIRHHILNCSHLHFAG